MGFLDDPTDAPTPAPTEPQQKPEFGGFLSDNPPPLETPSHKKQMSVPDDVTGYVGGMAANVPESGKKYIQDIWHGISHPIETATGIGKLAIGLAQKGHEAGFLPAVPQFSFGDKTAEEGVGVADAVGKMLVDRYGSVEKAKRTLYEDPVGTLGDISTILAPGAGATAKVPYLGKTLATAATVTDPLTIPIAGAKLTGKGAAMTLGYDTGAGMRSIEEAAKAGYEGGEAGKTFRAYQAGERSPEEFVNHAMDAKRNLLKERGLDYETGMIPVKNSSQVLSFSDIGKAMTDAHNVTEFKGEKLNLNPGVQNALQRMDDQIIHWVQLNPAEFHTPIGFDALKKSIDSIRQEMKPGTAERFAADKYYKAIDNTIRTQVPEYGKVMKDYADFSNEIRQIESTFSLPRDQRKTVIDTALRKMQSLLRRNVNTNFGQREKLADVLEASGAPHLKAAIAGMGLSSPEAHGLVRIIPALKSMDWKSIWDAAGSLGVSSPLIAGRIAHNAGRLAHPFKHVPIRGGIEASRQMGRLGEDGYLKARGGAVGLARRMAREH